MVAGCVISQSVPLLQVGRTANFQRILPGLLTNLPRRILSSPHPRRPSHRQNRHRSHRQNHRRHHSRHMGWKLQQFRRPLACSVGGQAVGYGRRPLPRYPRPVPDVQYVPNPPNRVRPGVGTCKCFAASRIFRLSTGYSLCGGAHGLFGGLITRRLLPLFRFVWLGWLLPLCGRWELTSAVCRGVFGSVTGDIFCNVVR